MELAFDISQDELPIFIAETDDQLQILDEGLVRLEREDHDVELIQLLFRAAHTLKGTAGMIGHQRLVEITHELESALDGIRKNTLPITTPLVDLCLDTVDCLRSLRNEVLDGNTSQVNEKELVRKFQHYINNANSELKGVDLATSSTKVTPMPEPTSSKGNPNFIVNADISQKSIASSARAFQLMLALQDLGELIKMVPSQEVIETAAPVRHFYAEIRSEKSSQEIHKELDLISEIDQINIESNGHHLEPSATEKSVAENPISESGEEEVFPLLGDFLVSYGHISKEQLNKGLAIQGSQNDPKLLLGQILVKNKFITQETLQNAIADLIQQQRSQLQAIKTAPDKTKEHSGDKTVRTSVERLDALMNLVGELITDRNRLTKVRSTLEIEHHGEETISDLADSIVHLSRITDLLQEEVMVIRMVPVANVFNKFPRLVRDLSQKAGKEVQLVIQGQETELDRSVIDELNDPLIHLIRNSIDHGIETPTERNAKGKPPQGVVRLTAHHEHGRIVITVEDDGKGIDTEKLKASAVQKGLISENEAKALSQENAIDLIFLSGLSTAAKVSDISGRGVGMDIVRNNIEKINGSVIVQTAPGKGTTFQIILPLTLAIVPTLLVYSSQTTFAIPLTAVVETLRINRKEIQSINGKPVIVLRDQVLPLISLADALKTEKSTETQKYCSVVVIKSIKTQLGLIVDSLIGKEEVVVKSLGSLFANVVGISGAAIMGDGSIGLIIDISGLFKSCGVH
jgi:two-component system, chemotaxis family, sensor kinase CheA